MIVFTASADAARRAFSPSLPIQSRFHVYRSRLPPGSPHTLLLSLLNLMPGTLAINLNRDGRLEFHAITEEPLKDVKQLEKQVARLYGIDFPADGARP